MKSIRFHVRLMKYLVAIGIVTALALPIVATGHDAEKAVEIKPIESLWLSSLPPFTTATSAEAAQARAQSLKKWHEAKVFDAFVLLDLPPTYVDQKGAAQRANALIKEAGGPFIVATLTVGKEGWESSGNERFTKKIKGAQYDASKAMTQAKWLETLKDFQSDTWAWILEAPARMPSPDEAAKSASEFVRFAKANKKKSIIWLSGEALTRGQAKFEALVKGVCEATRADADYFVWMDLPAESLSAGEDKWRETLAKSLDKILALTPKEKTVIQWLNNPKWPTKDVEGTKAYISICQGKGINRFCVLGLMEREPWPEFYRGLPRRKAGAK